VGTWRTGGIYLGEKGLTCRPSRLRRLASMFRLRRRESQLAREHPDDPPPDIGVREPRRPRPFGGAGAVTLDPPQ